MSLPARGEVVDAKREDADEVMWSVTTIIGVLDKPALIPWAVNVTAEKVVQKVDTVLTRLQGEGAESAIDYIKGLRWHTDGQLSDSQLGTVAHGLFDSYALSGHRPEITPELHPDHATKRSLLKHPDLVALHGMVGQFERFLEEYQPTYDACEVVVYHPHELADGSAGFGYAGQADAFLRINGVPLIADYKTSRKTYDGRGRVRAPYPEVGLQLAAYRHAPYAAVWRARRYEASRRRYYLLSPQEKAAAVPVPEVEGGVAIRITPDHYGVYPVRCGPEQWDTFLFCLELARWSFNRASLVVGNPMTPPTAPRLHLVKDDDPFTGLPA